MNCALFDKSTNFGTEVDQYIMKKFWCGANCPVAFWFSKMVASEHPNVRQSVLLGVLMNVYWMFWN